ncbi:MAG: hypothetical protein GOV15_03965 [Candidatus Diapherotrites archaeon]|nr:hypothetical protein [Candidatus Diapherotrites archaeon]
MVKKKVFREENIRELIELRWDEVADYLGKAKFGWGAFVKRIDKKLPNFVGFDVYPAQQSPWWGVKPDVRSTPWGTYSVVEVKFNPFKQNLPRVNHILGHELVHLFRKVLLKVEPREMESGLLMSFEQAIAEVVSLKSISDPKRRDKTRFNSSYYGELEAAMLSSVLNRMPDEIIVELAQRPKSVKDTDQLYHEIIGWLMEANHDKWFRKFFGR